MLPAAAAGYRDLSLEQAFELLEQQGVSVLYSSDLVKPWMRVRKEPAATEPKAVLSEILAPYGLGVADGPAGSVLIVRSAAPEEQPPAGSIAGTLRRIGDGTPLVGKLIVLEPGGRQTLTDARGRFEFATLAPARYALRVDADFLEAADEYIAEVRPGSATELAIEVIDLSTPPVEEIVVHASQYEFVREPTPSVTSMTAADLQLIPDVGDDPLRAVARLPGTASGDFTAKTYVRGGEVDETLVRFDGLRLYNPFHLKDFQSLFSTIDPRIIDGIEVYTGGFPAAFGDRMSAVIDIDPLRADQPSYQELSLSFFNASALASGSFDERRGDWLVSARRGNLDLILDILNPDIGEPSYTDFYGRLGHRLADSLAVTGNILLFNDDIVLFDNDQEEQARAEYRDEYYWLRFDYQASEDLSGALLLAKSEFESERGGRGDQLGVARGQLDDERAFSIESIQTDWAWRAKDDLLVRFGGEWRSAEGRYNYRDQVEFDVLFVTPGAPTEQSRMRQLSARPEGRQYAAYASVRLEDLGRLTAEAGLRWDKETLSPENEDQLSPRVSLLYQLGERTRLRASWGKFFQAQAISELQISDGVTDFFPAQRSNHLVTSIEYRHRSGIEIRLEAYRKDYRELRPRFENLLNPFILLPELKPDRVLIAPERAVAEGAELSLRGTDPGPLSWWLSYTWASVEDESGDLDTPRSWDQTHLFSGGLAWRGDRWELSLAGTYHTGWPTTEIELVETEPTPLVVAGPRNSSRLRPYHSLDARIARKFLFENAGRLTVFAELNNVLNRKNDCCVEYEVEEEDGELELDVQPLQYLSLFPSIGFIWQF